MPDCLAPNRQVHLGQDGVDTQMLRDVLERNVRGDPRIPDLLQHIELAHLAVEAGDVDHKADLVVIARISVAHGLLVEGREHHGIGAAGIGHFERLAEIGGGEGAALERGFAALDLVRRKMLQINHGMALASRGAGCCQHFKVQLDAGFLRAFVEDAAIADHDDAGSFPRFRIGQKHGRQFGADASRIAHRQGNDWARICGFDGHGGSSPSVHRRYL